MWFSSFFSWPILHDTSPFYTDVMIYNGNEILSIGSSVDSGQMRASVQQQSFLSMMFAADEFGFLSRSQPF